MMSFLAFHKNSGVDHFVVYDFGIPDQFHVALKTLSQIQNLNFTYSRVSWNFPFDLVDYKILRHMVEADCLYRTFGRSNLAVTLSWNEYMNLHYHSSMTNAIQDLNKVAVKSGAAFAAETLVMCVENTSDDASGSLNFSTPFIMSATKRLREGSEDERFFFEMMDRDEVFRKRGGRNKLNELATVYKFEGCHGDLEVIAGQGLRGAEKTPGSGIFQYYIKGKLFSD